MTYKGSLTWSWSLDVHLSVCVCKLFLDNLYHLFNPVVGLSSIPEIFQLEQWVKDYVLYQNMINESQLK